MALKFAKKAASIAHQAQDEDDDKPATKAFGNKSKASSSGNVSFFKKGAEAKAALQKEEAEAELRKQEAGNMWRFWMPAGEDRQITFLDGDLDDEGMLDIQMFYEHTTRVNGQWKNFVCTAEADQSQPCPICESGDRPSLVGVMTVIDHTPHKIKKGANAGKTIQNQRKLFVAKQGTLRILTKLAQKRGGLAGCTFDVSRTGDDEANVGNQFDFCEKFDSYEEIGDKFGLKLEEVQPADYDKEIVYRSPEDLIELGVGKAIGGPGTGKQSSSLKDEL